MRAGDQSAFLQKELVTMLCGELLGEGSARRVYEHKMDRTLVFKFEQGAGNFQNIMEWQVWDALKDKPASAWLAPCVAISPCGGVLIQRRTTRCAMHPEMIPAFLTDTKCANYGVLVPADGEQDGRFVCHDYGTNMLLEYGLTKRMRKANWWNL